MSAGNFPACLAVILQEEGGYSDRPLDKGGPTNRGVTLSTWQTWVGKSRRVTTQDIMSLTDADVAPLYQSVFWKGSACELLPAGVDLAVFDWSVNSGVGEGNRHLQMVLGVPADGLVGPVTLKAAAARDPNVLIDELCDARLVFYKEQPEAEWVEFGDGWTNRVANLRAHAHAMVAPAA